MPIPAGASRNVSPARYVRTKTVLVRSLLLVRNKETGSLLAGHWLVTREKVQGNSAGWQPDAKHGFNTHAVV